MLLVTCSMDPTVVCDLVQFAVVTEYESKDRLKAVARFESLY
jgi:hypothetical protein